MALNRVGRRLDRAIEELERELREIEASVRAARRTRLIQWPAVGAAAQTERRRARARKRVRSASNRGAREPQPAAAPSTLPAATGGPAAPAPQPAPPAAATPGPARPTGTDLADPKNFGLAPPLDALERGSLGTEDYRQRLAREIAFATRVLHTSGVVAAVWREWRAFEKTAQERLRELGARPAGADLSTDEPDPRVA